MSNSRVDVGLTERILWSFDPRKPLGRRRLLIYMFLYILVTFPAYLLLAVIIDPTGAAKLADSVWFGSVVPSILYAPMWMFYVRRAVAARIPVQAVYAYMAWSVVFKHLCEVTIGDGLEKLLTIPLVALAIGLFFKRNRMELPYPVN